MTFKDISKKLKINESSIKSSLYRMLLNVKNNCFVGEINEKQEKITKIL